MSRRNKIGFFWIAATDVGLLLLASAIAVLLRFGAGESASYDFWRLEGWLVLFGGVLLGNYLSGAYGLQHRYSRFNLVLQLLFALAFSVLLIGLVSYTWLTTALGRGLLGITLAVYGVTALLTKMIWHGLMSHLPRYLRRAAILSDDGDCRRLMEAIENKHVVPRHRVVALLTPDTRAQSETLGVPVMRAQPADIADTVRSLDLDALVIDVREPLREDYMSALKPLRFEGLQAFSALSAMECYAGRIPLDMAHEIMPLLDRIEHDLLLFSRMRRIFDVTICLIAGLLLLVPGIVLAAMIKLSAPRRPLFYMQTRAGHLGRPFRMIKFRSMTPDAEADTGPVWSGSGDARVTRLGGFMRRFRLDEIPQLYNIVKGDMSLVGPRPERPEMIEQVSRQVPFFDERLDVPPGLTGWAQIRYPYGESIEDAANKLEYDLYYIRNMSLLLDLRILINTLRIVLFGVKP